MTRGRFYSIAMPIAGILYVIALILTRNGTVAAVGAMLFAVIAIAGRAFGGKRGSSEQT